MNTGQCDIRYIDDPFQGIDKYRAAAVLHIYDITDIKMVHFPLNAHKDIQSISNNTFYRYRLLYSQPASDMSSHKNPTADAENKMFLPVFHR